MKQVFIFIVSCLTALSVTAQSISLTITVNGNKDRQLSLDGQDFTSEIAVTDDPVALTISNLAAGQHSLQVLQPASGSNPGMNKTTSFTLRQGYDMAIIVNSNGSVELKETLRPGNNNTTNNTTNTSNNTINNNNSNGGQYQVPMTDASFNQLYQDIKRQMLGPVKMSSLSATFARTGNYFTVSQVRQLIQLVSLENNRLQLAKSSYHCITDPANVSQLYDLIASQAGKDELAAYVNSFSNPGSVQNNSSVYSSGSAMSDANFNAIYNNVQSQWKPGGKMEALTNAFANTNNLFSVAQAKQLIQLVSSEINRLQLAKSAYRNIVDPANFTQIYDLFISQANRDELAAYVNSNPRQ